MIMGRQYLEPGVTHQGSLSSTPILSTITACPLPQVTYAEFTPYSAVSSFNLPAQCDSTLLTPSSSAASPPLHQPRELGRQFTLPPGTPQSPVSESPEDHNKMYQQWQTPFDLGGNPSGTSSPGAAQSSVAPDFQQSYMAGRRTPTSPEQQYMGNFRASSDGMAGQEMQPAENHYYMNMQPHVDHHSIPLRSQAGMHPDRDLGRSVAVGVHPVMAGPHPSRLQHDHRLGTDGFRHSTTTSFERQGSMSPGRRASNAARKKRSRRQSRGAILTLDPSGEHKNCRGEEVLPNFTSDMPPHERCIWEARWKHRDKKGENMWEHILAEYTQEFNGCKVPTGRSARENLQMKFKRSRPRYIEWLPEDDKILQECWEELERDRYKILLNNFHARGGSRNMCLGPEDIEVRVTHNLKLEEHLYMTDHDDLKVRRRRRLPKTTGRKRSTAGEPIDPQFAEVMHENIGGQGPVHNVETIMDQVLDCRQIKDEESIMDLDEAVRSQAWARPTRTYP